MESLKSFIVSVGLPFDEKLGQTFSRYQEVLLEWNKLHNLTSIKEEDILKLHFLDSLAPLQYFEIPKGAALIDVGTGAGFPGLPLKIVRPDLELTLLDAREKKVNFLKHVCNELKISGVSCIHGRAETLGHEDKFREQFDVACARALADFSLLSELLLPFVKIGGRALVMKGPKLEEEMEEGKIRMQELGGELEKVTEYKLPFSKDGRTLVEVLKRSPTPSKYPRKENVIKRERKLAARDVVD